MDFAGRMTAVRRAMQQHRIDLLALPPGDDLRYLTGFSPLADERPCYLFLSAKAGAFFWSHHSMRIRPNGACGP